MKSQDEFFMKRCLQIAKNGLFTARPNPSVGAVIVLNNKIISEAYTSPYGGNHAEVNAVAGVKNKSLLKKATIYVTLEPCAHFGKTPPCADMIVKHQFKRVVIGCIDTNSLVAGKGVERLKKANIEVLVGVLKQDCLNHHKRFFTFLKKKRPYIILKWAETKDGFIYPEVTKNSKNIQLKPHSIEHSVPIWISNNYSKQLVHKWRALEQGILVGKNTVLADNPKLNVRSWSGESPTRIVIDKNLQIPKNANVYDGNVKTIVLVNKSLDKNKIENFNNKQLKNKILFEAVDFSASGKLKASLICAVLHKYNIQSVIIEGGTQTIQAFIDENLWDKACVFIGTSYFEKGIKAPVLKKANKKEQHIKNDILKIYTND